MSKACLEEPTRTARIDLSNIVARRHQAVARKLSAELTEDATAW
jgi:hypothetical protein